MHDQPSEGNGLLSFLRFALGSRSHGKLSLFCVVPSSGSPLGMWVSAEPLDVVATPCCAPAQLCLLTNGNLDCAQPLPAVESLNQADYFTCALPRLARDLGCTFKDSEKNNPPAGRSRSSTIDWATLRRSLTQLLVEVFYGRKPPGWTSDLSPWELAVTARLIPNHRARSDQTGANGTAENFGSAVVEPECLVGAAVLKSWLAARRSGGAPPVDWESYVLKQSGILHVVKRLPWPLIMRSGWPLFRTVAWMLIPYCADNDACSQDCDDEAVRALSSNRFFQVQMQKIFDIGFVGVDAPTAESSSPPVRSQVYGLAPASKSLVDDVLETFLRPAANTHGGIGDYGWSAAVRGTRCGEPAIVTAVVMLESACNIAANLLWKTVTGWGKWSEPLHYLWVTERLLNLPATGGFTSWIRSRHLWDGLQRLEALVLEDSLARGVSEMPRSILGVAGEGSPTARELEPRGRKCQCAGIYQQKTQLPIAGVGINTSSVGIAMATTSAAKRLARSGVASAFAPIARGWMVKSGTLRNSPLSVAARDKMAVRWIGENAFSANARGGSTLDRAGAGLLNWWSCWPDARVNHKYRFVYVITAKTGSSTVEHAILAPLLCPPNGGAAVANRLGVRIAANCSERLPWDEWPDDEQDIARIWNEYLVFAVARNVWARAASAYLFLNSSRAADSWPSRVILDERARAWPRWGEFCRDPASLAKWAFCDGRCSEWQAFLVHVAPQSSCLLSIHGGSSVDILADTRHLDVDAVTILAEIARRASLNLGPTHPDASRARLWLETVRADSVPITNAVLSKGAKFEVEARLAAMFSEEGGGAGCIDALAAAYAEDVALLHDGRA